MRAKLKSLSAKKVDAIFHAAAVNDFAFGKFYSATAAGGLAEFKAARKISTRQEKLFVELLPTPKIIAGLRGWFPRAKITGWKFEADGSRVEAIAAARRQIADCSTDLCVVNGPAYGEGFGLLTASKGSHLANPPVLFEALEQFLHGEKVAS